MILLTDDMIGGMWKLPLPFPELFLVHHWPRQLTNILIKFINYHSANLILKMMFIPILKSPISSAYPVKARLTTKASTYPRLLNMGNVLVGAVDAVSIRQTKVGDGQ